jgi:hypothetical protein
MTLLPARLPGQPPHAKSLSKEFTGARPTQ